MQNQKGVVSCDPYWFSTSDFVNAVKDIRRDLLSWREICRKHLQVKLAALHLQRKIILKRFISLRLNWRGSAIRLYPLPLPPKRSGIM